MPHSLFALTGLALLVATLAAAAILGGARERWGAAAMAAAYGASMLFNGTMGARGVVLPLMAIDVGLLAALVALCWRSPTAWPVAASAFQATAVALHLVRLVQPRQDPWVYLTTLGLVSDGAVLSLAWGVWRAWRMRPSKV